MATTKTNKSKSLAIEPELGTVAFIDILGFSDRTKSLPWDGRGKEVKNLERDVRFVQNAFGHKTADAYLRLSHQIARKTVLAFSDCVVVSVPLKSPSTESSGVFDVFGSELHNFALAQAECVLEGIFLRGGVDLGWWYRRKDTLISAALVKAYEHEKIACVPVISLTAEITTFLEENMGRQFYSRDSDPFPKLLKRRPRIDEEQEFYFIDYLYLYLEALDTTIAPKDRARYNCAESDEKDRMRTIAYARACRFVARKHGKIILNKYRTAPNRKIKKKYTWLIDYHNDCVKRFFNSEAKKFLLKKK